MFTYMWPLALVVLSNVFYQICAKSVPEGMHPLASLTVTYLVGGALSLILYYALGKDANILREYRQVNWAPFVLGLAIVGLEVGYIYAYKAGWHSPDSPGSPFGSYTCLCGIRPLPRSPYF